MVSTSRQQAPAERASLPIRAQRSPRGMARIDQFLRGEDPALSLAVLITPSSAQSEPRLSGWPALPGGRRHLSGRLPVRGYGVRIRPGLDERLRGGPLLAQHRVVQRRLPIVIARVHGRAGVAQDLNDLRDGSRRSGKDQRLRWS